MQDNDISFWKNLVRHFFEPGALKRWCLSNYNMSPIGQHAEGLFPMVCKIMSPYYEVASYLCITPEIKNRNFFLDLRKCLPVA